jgi:hypothetical protein
MGTLFREVEQSQVDLEDLLIMLRVTPKIMQSPEAKDF